jgi:hypothetical protein
MIVTGENRRTGRRIFLRVTASTLNLTRTDGSSQRDRDRERQEDRARDEERESGYSRTEE